MLPRSSVVVGVCGGSAGGLGVSQFATCLGRRSRMWILGSRVQPEGDVAIARRLCHRSLRMLCRAFTRTPFLQDIACSTDIPAPQPSQCDCMPWGPKLFRSLAKSRHSVLSRLVSLSVVGMTVSHAPFEQLRLSQWPTDAFSCQRRLRAIISSSIRAL